jgi:hypothetical protein
MGELIFLQHLPTHAQVTEMQWLFEPDFRVKYACARSLANKFRIWNLFNFIQLAFMVPVA